MPIVARVHAAFVALIDAVVGATLALVVSLTATQVTARYVFNVGIPWVNESARFTFIWLVMLGAGAASARGVHIAFDMLLYRLAGWRRVLLGSFVAGASALFLLILVTEGWKLVQLNVGQRSPVLGLPMWVVSAAVPVGATLCLVGLVLNLLARPSDQRAGPEL